MAKITVKKKPSDPRRNRMYAFIHVAKSNLSAIMDDDQYRNMLDERYGVRSLKGMSYSQLNNLIDYMETLGFKPKRKAPKAAGKMPLADSDIAKKIRALWVDLYWLGCIDDRSEEALSVFVKRQTKVERLAWLKPHHGFKVIEALKAMATRSASVDWSKFYLSPKVSKECPELRVLLAQWTFLYENGHRRMDAFHGLDRWGMMQLGENNLDQSLIHFPTEKLSKLIVSLGKDVRKAKGK